MRDIMNRKLPPIWSIEGELDGGNIGETEEYNAAREEFRHFNYKEALAKLEQLIHYAQLQDNGLTMLEHQQAGTKMIALLDRLDIIILELREKGDDL